MNAQVALLINARGKVERAIHVSTGAGGRTPQGDFHVYRKETMFLVGAVQRLAAAGELLHGRHRVPLVPRRPRLRRLARLRPHPGARGPVMYAFAKVGTPTHVHP